MKRVFPLIVVLITLSVLGIIVIQISWINNAIDLRKQQHEQEIANATSEIRENFYKRYVTKSGQFFPDDDSRQNFLERRFSVLMFTDEEARQIIDRSLRRQNIRQPYEYMVTNMFRYPIKTSRGFKMENQTGAIELTLTPENSYLGKETLYLFIKEDKNYIFRTMGWMIIGSLLFTIIIISAFALTVRTLFTQKKLSEIKSDFINNMTHELKTPLATISLAIDALTNEKVIHDTGKIRYYSGMIKDENKRMNKQVEKILQAARIERQEINLNLTELNAHDVIHKVADNLELQIQEHSGELTLNLHAKTFMLQADDVHFSNVIFNLLDNAIKYAKDKPKIEVETLIVSHMFAIKVRDNGIGMSKETQSRVFEKFYRAHTGNLHNVKGFGLGLSYVKAIVEAHGGRVKVESALGKGSIFSVYFPLPV